MNFKSSLLVLVYSALVAICGVIAHIAAPETASVSLIAGVVAACVSAVLGTLALAGRRTRALTILTLVPVTFTLLSQTVQAWGSADPGRGYSPWANLLITVMFLLSVAMLAYLAYTGQFPAVSTEQSKTSSSGETVAIDRSDATRGPREVRTSPSTGGNGIRRSNSRTL